VYSPVLSLSLNDTAARSPALSLPALGPLPLVVALPPLLRLLALLRLFLSDADMCGQSVSACCTSPQYPQLSTAPSDTDPDTVVAARPTCPPPLSLSLPLPLPLLAPRRASLRNSRLAAAAADRQDEGASGFIPQAASRRRAASSRCRNAWGHS
jgi:hypothetical protein